MPVVVLCPACGTRKRILTLVLVVQGREIQRLKGALSLIELEAQLHSWLG